MRDMPLSSLHTVATWLKVLHTSALLLDTFLSTPAAEQAFDTLQAVGVLSEGGGEGGCRHTVATQRVGWGGVSRRAAWHLLCDRSWLVVSKATHSGAAGAPQPRAKRATL